MVQNGVEFGCRFKDLNHKSSTEGKKGEKGGYVKSNCIQQEAD